MKDVAEGTNQNSARFSYGVCFAIGSMAFLTALELGSVAFLHTWNSEVLAAVTSLIVLVTGTLIAAKS